MNEQDLEKAIRYLKPDAEFSFTENDYLTVKWDFLDGNAPTLEEIQAAHLQVKADEAAIKAEADAKRQALLDKLGITEQEIKLLLA